MAVALPLVQTKQIRINVHKRNNTKTQYRQYKTINVSTDMTKIPTHYKTILIMKANRMHYFSISFW